MVNEPRNGVQSSLGKLFDDLPDDNSANNPISIDIKI